jgi:hypothetical protein
LEQVCPHADELFSSIAVKFLFMAGAKTALPGGSRGNMVQYRGQRQAPPFLLRARVISNKSIG